METNKPKARLVAIGRHMLSCLSANDYIEIGERRWHALHNRAQEMLEDSRRFQVLNDEQWFSNSRPINLAHFLILVNLN